MMMFLGRGDWVEGLTLHRQPYIRQLGPEDVQGIADATGQLQSAQDVAPLALANHALRADAEEHDAVHTVMRSVLGELKV
jgi:hypothetical protein